MTKIKPQENISKLPGSWVSVVCVDYPGCRDLKLTVECTKFPHHRRGWQREGEGGQRRTQRIAIPLLTLHLKFK